MTYRKYSECFVKYDKVIAGLTDKQNKSSHTFCSLIIEFDFHFEFGVACKHCAIFTKITFQQNDDDIQFIYFR